MKNFIKIFGVGGLKEKELIKATTWDGSRPVWIYYPKKLTPNMKKKVGEFILDELDDHEVYDEFIGKT